MEPDPRDQFDLVGKLDQIVVGAGRKRIFLDDRIFLGREHDDRDVPGGGVGAIPLHQGEPVHARHDQILEDDRRLETLDDRDRVGGIAAIVKIDVGLVREHAPDRLADHRLIVNEQHHVDVGVRGWRHNRLAAV